MKLLTAMFILISGTAFAKVKIEKIEYNDGETLLEGALVYDTSFHKKNKKTAGVIVVHDWLGIGDDVMMRAQQLAGLGYVAFVADIYGKNVRPKNSTEAGIEAGKYKAGERTVMRSRAQAAFNFLSSNKFVDVNKISAIGYCFGGTVVLEMARIGMPLAGVISFHGGLSAINKTDNKNIKSKVLILHGAIDPFVPTAEVTTFQQELTEAQINYEFVSYSGAVHAFTIKGAGDDVKTGAAYNEQADRRSFAAMKNFLIEVSQ